MREEKPESKKPEVHMAPTNPYPNSQLETVMAIKEIQTGGGAWEGSHVWIPQS